MPQHAALMFANDTFYVAFSSGDYKTMESVWAQSDQLTCTHPGWDTLIGREEVMDSWSSIMENVESVEISCSHANGYVLGDVGYVLCYEKTNGVVLAATNVFVLEDGVWKIVHHQSGPAPGMFDEDEDENDPLERMQ